MILAKIFKSKKQRLKEKANSERAFDRGRQTSHAVIKIIDESINNTIIPALQHSDGLLCDGLTKLHKARQEDVYQYFNDHKKWLERLRVDAETRVNDDLGEWKYLLIELDLKADFDRYIAATLDPLFEKMNDNLKGNAAYAIARIGGHITDEMDAMSPDELKAYVEQRDGTLSE